MIKVQFLGDLVRLGVLENSKLADFSVFKRIGVARF